MSDSPKAIFLSYASQDAEAAQRICDALRTAGLEVWFDRNELVGGDAWDQKIRKQIKECALFVPLISANTNARAEGYFRLEWKLAVDRSHLMADDQPFLFPIVVGDVNDATARVPDKFREVQWTRLRLDETPAELAARVTKLLDGGSLEAGRPRPADRGEGAPAPEKLRRKRERPVWLRHAWSVLALVIVGYYALRPLWHERRSEPETNRAVEEKSAASEARQLAERARQLTIDKYNSTADDFVAAEALLKRALEMDATDGEIWAISSLVNTAIRTRGFSDDPARREVARSHAVRALALAPASVEAKFALGRWQRDNEPDLAVAEKTFLEVIAQDPRHAGALSSLGSLYNRSGRDAEALAMFERQAEIPGSRALARYSAYLVHFGQRRFAEAEQCLRDSIAAEPSSNAVCGLAMVLLTGRGDPAAARAALQQLPAASRSEHRAVWIAAFTRLAAREPDAALEELRRLPADFIQDNWFVGPRDYWAGCAHEMAGRREAARIAFESGLAVVDRQIKAFPRDHALHVARGELLARLGRAAEARQCARTATELAGARGLRFWFNSPVRIHAALGDVEEALPLLRRFLTGPDRALQWPLTPALLRVDPLWDKLRENPGFRSLLDEAAANELAARPARDWPKHPELKRAMELIEGLESIPDDLALAEQLVKPIVERAPTDGEAVTVMARVQSQFMRRGFDRSDERSAQARLYGERALQLDPNEPEAMLAVATYLFSRGTGDTRAERLLRRAMEVDPANPRPGRLLADLLNVTPGREAEAIVQGQENVRRFPKDPLTRYDLARHYKDQGRYEEFDRELDATLALAPLPNAMAWKARLQFGLHNDFAGMKRWLDQVPERVRGTERAVFGYFIYAAFGGDAETGLEALRAFPQKWFTDFEYAGTTALLNACLLERQGKNELARQQYELALQEARRMKATDPTRLWLNHAEFWPLLGLGRKEEAKAVFQRLIEAQRRPYSQSLVNGWWFTLIPGSLLLGERDTALELLRESVTTLPESRAAFRVRFQLDPRMAPFRDDAEIQALLAEPAVKP